MGAFPARTHTVIETTDVRPGDVLLTRCCVTLGGEGATVDTGVARSIALSTTKSFFTTRFYAAQEWR